MSAVSERVWSGLNEAIRQIDPDRLITKAIIVAEYIDSEGERCIGMYGSPDIRGWDIDALAGYAAKVADVVERTEIEELMSHD